MKKKLAISLAVVFAVIVCITTIVATFTVVSSVLFPRLSVVSTPTLEKKTTILVPGSYGFRTWISSYNGNLLFCADRENSYGLKPYYSDWLCAVEEGKIKKLINLSPNGCGYIIIGQQDQWIYYIQYERFPIGTSNEKLYCYDLEQGTEKLLYSNAEDLRSWDEYHGIDGSFYLLSTDKNFDDKFIRIKDGSVAEEGFTYLEIPLESGTYGFEAGHLSYSFYAADSGGEKCKLFKINSFDNYFFPFQGQMMLASEWEYGLLCRIDSNGQMEKFLDFPKGSKIMSFCVTENEILLSVQRYDALPKQGPVENLQFDDDPLSGTYRFDAETLSVEKITDRTFFGLYCVDGSQVYGYAEDKIYKLSPSGETEEIVVFE